MDGDPRHDWMDIKKCSTCAHSFTEAADPKYRRCDKANPADIEKRLCGVMRKIDSPCGPEATMWEPRDGET